LKSDKSLERLRAICGALPETEERVFGGHTTPTWRVRDKIFAMMPGADEADGRMAVWCKAPPGAQEVLVSSDPGRFYRPPYVGPKGWVGVWLDDGAPWDVIDDLVRDSYRLIAPTRLAHAVDGAAPSTAAAPQAKVRSGAKAATKRGRR
jgi:predicted DNA-binding protein (MmcQ/YjbR family)